MHANPLSLPIGLQLYTVGAEMDKDPFGTLKRVASIGYKEVELSPLSKTPAKDLLKALHDNGLANPSGHFMVPDLLSSLQKNIDAAKEFGQDYMVITVPWVADPSRFNKSSGGDQMAFVLAMLNGLTLDDWKWNAEQFNKIGEQTKKAGLQLGYHNHNFEFKAYSSGTREAVTGYDEFIRLTDPELVKLELDCGWMTVAGKDPVAYLAKYPDRYRLLHIKDFRKGFTPRTTLMDKDPGVPVPAELGRGAIDYHRIFAAAEKVKIRAMYVEQEPPFTEMPALEAIQVDYEYLHKLHD
ncbi:MAG TPA: sugar phosphate isomerase/epimerase [Bryobacteraceae bacterium]|jgi:sugar phosphate isomerase/epimerase|nr:sugar phosphate isomerase/epimerase [Bryobacteraceae bacterium]